jgi:prealbumin domain-containing protein
VDEGWAHVAGNTASLDFPSANPLQRGKRKDAFAVKLTKDGQKLEYSTYLGGDNRDEATSIAVHEGQAYVAGNTASPNFLTTTPTPLQSTRGGRLGLKRAGVGAAIGETDVFVTKLTPNGQKPVYSTSLGGSGKDRVGAIDVNSQGEVSLIGTTTSGDFPIKNSANSARETLNGPQDAFIVKLTEDGQKLVHSFYLGGPGEETGRSIAVDREDHIHTTLTSTEPVAAADNIGSGGNQNTQAGANAVGGSLIVTVQDFVPDIAVQKKADPTSVPAANGGSVTYTVMITNNTTNSTEALMLTDLSDDKVGNLNGQGTCTVPQTLAAKGADGDTYRCSFERSLPPGDPANPHVNTVTATAKNDAGIEDIATDKATVRFTSTATLKVIKQVMNDSGGTAKAGDFTMYVNGNNPDRASFNGEESGTTVKLDAGNYNVTEGSVTGYTQIGASPDCSGTIAAGETKTCTITNHDQPATLIVKKTVINDNGGTTPVENFSFSVNGGAAVAFEADGQNDLTVAAGTYTVTEPAVAGYTTTFNNCSEVVIPNGGTATCEITNDDQLVIG